MNDVEEFGTLLDSFLIVIQILTLEGWWEIMNTTIEKTGWWAAMYFISWVLVGCYFLLEVRWNYVDSLK